MIPIGTVCYLTGDHELAGQCCVVISPLQFGEVQHGDRKIFVNYYDIELSSGERTDPWDGCEWVAEPSDLIPITPPGLTTDEDKRIPVAA